MIERAIRSALDQTFGNLEILLCDGVLSQETVALCDEQAALDPRIRIVRDHRKLNFIDACAAGLAGRERRLFPLAR